MVIRNRELTIEKIKSALAVLPLLFTVAGVGFSVINFYILNKLQPVNVHIDKVEAEASKAREDIKTNQELQTKIIDTLATKQQVNDVAVRLDKISSRVDLIIGKLIK
jgi:hypothetical protein